MAYLCVIHNKINEENGKELFDCGIVGEFWAGKKNSTKEVNSPASSGN